MININDATRNHHALQLHKENNGYTIGVFSNAMWRGHRFIRLETNDNLIIKILFNFFVSIDVIKPNESECFIRLAIDSEAVYKKNHPNTEIQGFKCRTKDLNLAYQKLTLQNESLTVKITTIHQPEIKRLRLRIKILEQEAQRLETHNIRLAYEKQQEAEMVLEVKSELQKMRMELSRGVVKTQYIYDRMQLQKTYSEANKSNSLKTIPLKIVHYKNDELNRISAILNDWYKLCFQQLSNYQAKSSKVAEGSEGEKEFSRQIHLFDSLRTVIGQTYRWGLNNQHCVAAVLDDNDEIQAICSFCDDTANDSTWKIDYLVTSPHNIRGEMQPRVEGAGTALIQDAIEQAITKRGLNPASALTICPEYFGVTLESIFSAKDFYYHIGFKDYKSPKGVENMILTGDNLVSFLRKYGGRASQAC